ncbi:MAG: prepilin-type N-terminal cleavage/methylation domain-containing protein [Betaproteobacteria bacterium]|nr:prepilin-type N-terminal cleavage/methylation domain-containing protein [Betaproteobacteria bacterium]
MNTRTITRLIRAQRAYSLVEILLAIAVIAILAAIAIPNYYKYIEKARVAQAVTDIGGMSMIIVKYMDDNNYTPPDDLATVKMDGRLDPWGRPYMFTNLVGVKGKGTSRKDKKLNPLNSDFDLYSVGKDGDSKLPLSPKVSQDDVIRARDGQFIGLASEFDP